MILLLALSLWPMASFGALDCCPEGGAFVEQASAVADPHAHHDMHGTDHAAAGSGEASGSPAMADCDEPGASTTAHATCDAECAARCAAPSVVLAPAAWPAQLHQHQQHVPWHAGVPPRPQGACLLRPPIHA